MPTEPSATTSTMIVAVATEQGAVAAESPRAADVRWEFRLTADRRRILIPVNPTAHPEVE
jgi:hypothetical protein